MTHQITLTFELDDETLEGILISAGEQWSGSWARSDHALIEALKRDVQLWDAEDPKEFHGVLNREKLLRAPQALLDACKKNPDGAAGLRQVLADLITGEILDAPQSDCVVQAALFGEVRFG